MVRSNMTWSKYHRNCVLTGPLDGYCLVCEAHMRNEDEYTAHLEKPIHKKNLEATLYFEKHKDDYVRKVKKGYYCEFCNLLFFTATKVGLHVTEVQHMENKRTNLLRRIDNTIFVYNNVLIEDKAWNGFVDDTCIICNTEFDNEGIHKTEQGHILNLIQKNVEFGEGESVFRKTDENGYQCLICNLPLAVDQYSTHYKEDSHKNKVENSRKTGQQILSEKTVVKQEVNIEPKVNAEINASTAETVKDPVKNNTNESVIPKTINVDETNKKKNNIPDNKKPIEAITRDSIKNAVEMDKYICDVLGAKNYVTPSHGGNSMCILCDWSMESHAVAAHISGRHHLTMLRLHKDRIQKMSTAKDSTDQVKEEKRNDPKRNGDAKPNNAVTDNDKNKIVDSLQEFQRNDININFEAGVATCKKCSKSLNLEYDGINSHIEEHKKKPNKKQVKQTVQSAGNETKTNGNTQVFSRLAFKKEEPQPKSNPLPRDIEEFVKKNELTFSNGTIRCQVCDTSLPHSLKSLKEHVDGAQHRVRSKIPNCSVSPGKIPDVKKVPVNEFVKSLTNVRNSLVNDIVVNEKFNISNLSFLMFTKHGSGLKCQLCEKELPTIDEADTHRIVSGHQDMFLSGTMVIASMENEFIREPRPGVFHCGFCHLVEEGWDEMLDHLGTVYHRESRRSAQWRLQEHWVDLRRQQSIEHDLMSFMMNKFAQRSEDDW